MARHHEGQWDLAVVDLFLEDGNGLGVFEWHRGRGGAGPEAAASLGDLDPALVDRMEAIIDNDRVLRWSVKQRGFWMNCVATMRESLREIERFSTQGRTGLIRCPTLFTQAPAGRNASLLQSVALPQATGALHARGARRGRLRDVESFAGESALAGLVG